MSDEHFLARWSRRKRDVAAEEAASGKPASGTPADAGTKPQPVAHSDERTSPRSGAASESDRPFDPASLPSLDSITGSTDMRAFMAPGVPSTVAREALRRAWSADPAIRDFVGLQDYDFDFNTPGAIAGFSEFGSEHADDIRQMAARIMGDAQEEPDPVAPDAAASPAPNAPQGETEGEVVRRTDEAGPAAASDRQPVADAGSADAGVSPPGIAELPMPTVAGQQSQDLLHSNKDTAMHHDDLVGMPRRNHRRMHGGALPKS